MESYGLGKPDIEALRDSVDFAIYTPGSDAGLPVSIMASLSAPPIPWEGNKEILREKISSTVTAILGLVGLKDIDPVRAREHILLANIFEEAWKEGKDLNMATLITHVQSPTFDKLGVFPLEQFYPEKDRFELAMLLNNFLAAPAFQTWLEGSLWILRLFSSMRMANRGTTFSTWRTLVMRSGCSSSPYSIPASNPGCEPRRAPVDCGPWSILMRLQAIYHQWRTRPARVSSCACSNKPVRLAWG